MELGLITFADVGNLTPQERLRNLMEQVRLADELGLEVSGVGEHHRPDYAVSAPAVVLGAAAVQTKDIRLASAVTVLGSDDPVRVSEAQSTCWRAAAPRSWPAAGRSPSRSRCSATTSRTTTSCSPRSSSSCCASATASGSRGPAGSAPRSRTRACGRGRSRTRCRCGSPSAARRRRSSGAATLGLALTVNTHAWVGDDRAEFARHYMAMMGRIGRERGWPPMTPQQYEALRSPRGALTVGSPQEVIEKILFNYELFHHQRYLAHMSLGAVEHRDVLRSLERFATEVAPAVRAELARQAAA